MEKTKQNIGHCVLLRLQFLPDLSMSLARIFSRSRSFCLVFVCEWRNIATHYAFIYWWIVSTVFNGRASWLDGRILCRACFSTSGKCMLNISWHGQV